MNKAWLNMLVIALLVITLLMGCLYLRVRLDHALKKIFILEMQKPPNPVKPADKPIQVMVSDHCPMLEFDDNADMSKCKVGDCTITATRFSSMVARYSTINGMNYLVAKPGETWHIESKGDVWFAKKIKSPAKGIKP